MEMVSEGAALCTPFLNGLPISGLSITVITRAGAQSTVSTSDLIAARLEELQFQLGEGPTPDVIRTGVPVLTEDLRANAVQELWPVFAIEAVASGAQALFSFPLLVESATIGVVSLYSLILRPPWSNTLMEAAIDLVAAAATPAADLATRSAGREQGMAGSRQTEMRREVHQAAGMLMVQLDCSITEAMTRLRAHAYLHDRPIDAIAREIIRGDLFLAADD
jgi:hypothetical protein